MQEASTVLITLSKFVLVPEKCAMKTYKKYVGRAPCILNLDTV